MNALVVTLPTVKTTADMVHVVLWRHSGKNEATGTR